MGNVNLNELGLSFVKTCLQNYWGSICFFGIFVACLFSIYIYKKRETVFIILYTILLFLTIYTPILVKMFYSKLGSDVIYYRFFWLLPVSILIAYGCVEIIAIPKDILKKFFVAIFLCMTIIITGVPLKSVQSAVTLPENLYKVPDSLLEMCDVIHQDSDIKNPRVAAETTLHMYMRQYDPSIILPIDRDVLLHYNGNRTVWANPDLPSYQEQAAILAVILYGAQEDSSAFINSINNTQTGYLIIQSNATTNDFLINIGCSNLGEYGGYTLYRTFI